MGNTAFTGRQVGEGAEVLEAMARDRECFVVMTLAGAMTVAKQGLIVTDLIDAGVVHAVISTGALMAHGLVEAAGRSHFRYDPRMDDNELYDAGYNRVYDTLEPETNLDFVETIVARILKGWDHNEPLCSYKLNRDIGKYLSENVKERGILKSAYENRWSSVNCGALARFDRPRKAMVCPTFQPVPCRDRKSHTSELQSLRHLVC